jgi:putative cardiolipin synthase
MRDRVVPRGRPRVVAVVVSMLVFGACASLPDDYPPPPRSVALEPDPSTRLGRIEARFAETHGGDVSGFASLDANGEGLRWRLALVDSADQSLDLQYYLWYGDPSGLLLLHRVLHAADRGVRVRILLDDILFLKGKATLADLENHPNIEIRIYNPWASKGVGRAFEFLGQMKRLNHRMHNKLLIADGQMAILGGRNVGDHYFGLGHNFNFHDLDMIVLGDAASASSEIFDHFWNSDRVLPASAFEDDPSWARIEEVRPDLVDRLRQSEELEHFPVEPRDWTAELAGLADRMSPGTFTVEFDRLLPDSDVPTQDGVLALAEIVQRAQREVLIANAYIIPGERMLDILHDATDRGVRVRMLTNSLASQDVPAVTKAYGRHRRALLEAGVELYEFRSDPEIQPGIVDTAPVEAKFAGYHVKTLVVDRETVYVGSLNLDPRSIRLNTEMGMIVTSPELANEVAALIERDMLPTNSWRVGLDADGDLVWASSAGTVTKQPARNSWQRFEAWIMGIVPESQL